MFETAVECSKCGELFDFNKPLTVCTRCGGALLIQYDLAKVARNVSKRALGQRQDTSIPNWNRNEAFRRTRNGRTESQYCPEMQTR